MSKYSHFLAHYLTRERKKITQHLQLLSLRAPVECGQENKMSQKSLWGRIKKTSLCQANALAYALCIQCFRLKRHRFSRSRGKRIFTNLGDPMTLLR